MRMENMFSGLEVADWLRGLVAACVSGGSSAVVSGGVVAVQDPEHFRGGGALKLMGLMFVTNAAMGMFLYLKQKPVPDVKTVTTTVQTTEKQKAAVIQTTVQEVHQEPLEPPKV